MLLLQLARLERGGGCRNPTLWTTPLRADDKIKSRVYDCDCGRQYSFVVAFLLIRAQPITGPKYHNLGSSFGFERNSELITKKGTNYDPTPTHRFENSPTQSSNFRNLSRCSD